MLPAQRENLRRLLMQSTTVVKVAGGLFGVIGLVHLSRVIWQFDVIVGNWMVPIWVNVLGAVVALGLSFLLLKK